MRGDVGIWHEDLSRAHPRVRDGLQRRPLIGPAKGSRRADVRADGQRAHAARRQGVIPCTEQRRVISVLASSRRAGETTMKAIADLPTFDPESGELLSVVETPKDSRNKYAFNPSLGLFELRRVLPRGMLFPYDFGFIPATKADDGDPLDVLLMLEDSAPQGCVIRDSRHRGDRGPSARGERRVGAQRPPDRRRRARQTPRRSEERQRAQPEESSTRSRPSSATITRSTARNSSLSSAPARTRP